MSSLTRSAVISYFFVDQMICQQFEWVPQIAYDAENDEILKTNLFLKLPNCFVHNSKTKKMFN